MIKCIPFSCMHLVGYFYVAIPTYFPLLGFVHLFIHRALGAQTFNFQLYWLLHYKVKCLRNRVQVSNACHERMSKYRKECVGHALISVTLSFACTFELNTLLTHSHRIVRICHSWWRRWNKNPFLLVSKSAWYSHHTPGTEPRLEWMDFAFHLASILSIVFSLFLSMDARVNLLACIYFAMSTHKECIGGVVCLTCILLRVAFISFVHIRFVALLFLWQFNEVVSATAITTPAFVVATFQHSGILNRSWYFFHDSCALGWFSFN